MIAPICAPCRRGDHERCEGVWDPDTDQPAVCRDEPFHDFADRELWTRDADPEELDAAENRYERMLSGEAYV